MRGAKWASLDRTILLPLAMARAGKYKLLVGKPGGEWQASWYGLFSPNASTPKVNENFFACG